MTDANFLAGLLEVPDSVLVRMLLDDTRDLAAMRLAIMDVVAANRVPGVGGGMSPAGRRVIEAMGEEQQARGDVQRQEYMLLGLLRGAAGPGAPHDVRDRPRAGAAGVAGRGP